MKEYFTILGKSESEFIINRSRFITNAMHVTSMDEAREFIATISKKYSDATHNCYAFISDKLGLEMRFSDDGEPQGTAGQPILEVIKKKNLKEVAVVVTRYFGGIKLGAGGLVASYTEGAVTCLDNATIVKMIPCETYEVKVDYPTFSVVEKLLNNCAIVLDTIYENEVTIKFGVPTSSTILSAIKNATSGKVEPIKTGEEYVYDNNFAK